MARFARVVVGGVVIVVLLVLLLFVCFLVFAIVGVFEAVALTVVPRVIVVNVVMGVTVTNTTTTSATAGTAGCRCGRGHRGHGQVALPLGYVIAECPQNGHRLHCFRRTRRSVLVRMVRGMVRMVVMVMMEPGRCRVDRVERRYARAVRAGLQVGLFTILLRSLVVVAISEAAFPSPHRVDAEADEDEEGGQAAARNPEQIAQLQRFHC